MLKNSVPGNCVAAASQLRSCGSHPHSSPGPARAGRHGRRRSWRGSAPARAGSRGAREEDRPDEVRDAVGRAAHRVEVGRHRTEDEAGGTHHEQPGDRRVEARWSHGHPTSLSLDDGRCSTIAAAVDAAAHPDRVTVRVVAAQVARRRAAVLTPVRGRHPPGWEEVGGDAGSADSVCWGGPGVGSSVVTTNETTTATMTSGVICRPSLPRGGSRAARRSAAAAASRSTSRRCPCRSPARGSCRAGRSAAMPSTAPTNIAGNTGPPRNALSDSP